MRRKAISYGSILCGALLVNLIWVDRNPFKIVRPRIGSGFLNFAARMQTRGYIMFCRQSRFYSLANRFNEVYIRRVVCLHPFRAQSMIKAKSAKADHAKPRVFRFEKCDDSRATGTTCEPRIPVRALIISVRLREEQFLCLFGATLYGTLWFVFVLSQATPQRGSVVVSGHPLGVAVVC